MQCRSFRFCLFVFLFVETTLVVLVKCNNSYLKNSNNDYKSKYEPYQDDGQNPEEKTMYNRMICENEKLQIECKSPNHVLSIQRAYYGRYSITPCNKNHLKFAKGCTANNTIHIIKKLCEGKTSCNQKITTSLFKYDPCPGIDKVLEINYYCVLHKRTKFQKVVKTKPVLTSSSSIVPSSETTQTTTVPITSSLFTTTPLATINILPKSTLIQTEPEIKTTKIINPKTTIIIKEKQLDEDLTFNHQSLSSNYDVINTQKCYFSKNNITKLFLADLADFAADVNQFISLPCTSLNNKKSSGSTFYKCHSDGLFHYFNSTCVSHNEQSSTENFNLEDIMVKNDKIIENTKIDALIDFIKNASTKIISTMNEDSTSLSTQNLSNIIINAVDTLIGKTSKWNDLTQEEKSKSVTKLFDTVDTVVFENKIANQESQVQTNFIINTENIHAEVSSNNNLKKKIKFPALGNSDSDENVLLTLKKPKKSQVFMFMVYKSVNELLTSKQEYDDIVVSIDKNQTINSKQIINSNIISFKMSEKEDINYLKEEPIELTFKHLVENPNYDNLKPTCSYWNYNKNTFDGYWSPDGCTLEFTNKSHTICKCNHLTHFAILIDIRGVHENYADIHKTILSIITILFSSISCVCIILTLLAFRFVKIIKKNREQSTTKDLTVITTHLCVCLLASLSVFLMGIAVKHLKLGEFCSTIAVLSHYFFLCAFFWMLLEGVQLYLMLVHIFSLKNSPIKKFCFLAYGTPLIIVSCSKLVDYYTLDSMGYGTSEHCWLSNYHNFNLTFIVPITLILIANFVILVIVIYGMRNSMASRQVHNKKQDDFFKSLLGFWCIILTLLGLPWIIGYFILDSQHTLIFSYLFTIINTSQGTIVFFFHCIISKNVREELFRSLRKQKHRILKSTSSTSSNSKLTSNANRTSKNLQRTTSDSSSFRTLKKSMDSARLLDRKSSNCSHLQKNSLFTDSLLNNDNSIRLSKQKEEEEKRTFFRNLYTLVCGSTDSFENKKKTNKNSQSFSYSSRSCTDTNISPVQNYSPDSVSPFNSNYVKIDQNENDDTFIKLLSTEPYFNSNSNNSQFYNMNSSNYMPSNNLHRPQIYLTNDASLIGALQKRNSGSINMNYRVLNSSNIRRTLSQMSDSSGQQIQKAFIPSLGTPLPSNSIININSTQIPTIPPPPLPIGVYGVPSHHNSPTPQTLVQKMPILSRKNTTDSRFSTFKSNVPDKQTKFRFDPSTATLEKPIIASNIIANKRLAAYDENQYLTPEYHSYSMVDSEFQSEYYCDDGICSVGIDDDLSNNYQEVLDQEEDESPNATYAPYSNNFNKRFKIIEKCTHKSKLKDLISMPEELDKEYSIENSNVSETSIFNNDKLKVRTSNKEQLDKIPSVSNCSVAHLSDTSSTTGTSSNTSLSQSSTLLNNIDPDENSKAKKILQRL